MYTTLSPSRLVSSVRLFRPSLTYALERASLSRPAAVGSLTPRPHGFGAQSEQSELCWGDRREAALFLDTAAPAVLGNADAGCRSRIATGVWARTRPRWCGALPSAPRWGS